MPYKVVKHTPSGVKAVSGEVHKSLPKALKEMHAQPSGFVAVLNGTDRVVAHTTVRAFGI